MKKSPEGRTQNVEFGLWSLPGHAQGLFLSLCPEFIPGVEFWWDHMKCQ